MKILYLSLMMIFGSSLVAMSNHAFADNTDGVEILNIHTQPSTIKVGDKFVVIATLVNNSTIPIFVERGACVGPLFIAFDSHVTTDDEKVTCTLQIISQKLNPGHKIVGTSSNHSYLTYRATASGTTNATVSFSYFVMSQTDLNQSRAEPTISKSFLFTISDNKSNPMSIDYGGRHTTNLIDPPLKQFKSGIHVNEVQCREGLQLVVKLENNHPSCTKSLTALHLLERNWGYIASPFDTAIDLLTSKISGGTIIGYHYDLQSKSILIKIQTTSDGILTVTIPRVLNDAKIGQYDNHFFVLADGQEIDFKEIKTTDTERTLTIPFHDGTSKIEIIGTQKI